MNVIIFGATSAIAAGAARHWARQGANLHLVARDQTKLSVIEADLKTRGAQVTSQISDLSDPKNHEACIAKARAALGGTIDAALIAYGTMTTQEEADLSFEISNRVIQVNYTSSVSLLMALAPVFQSQRSGVIAAISSVAGERGRKSNYLYGSTKAALSAYLSGLRGKLLESGVTVLTVKPGFTDTPMTKDYAKTGMLWASADQVGGDIVRAVAQKRDVFYTPGFWCFIMWVIRMIPERIFKKMKI